MEDHDPEHRRKLVTYGKSSKKSSQRNESTQSRLQLAAPFTTGPGNRSVDTLQFRTQILSQMPETDHGHLESHARAQKNSPRSNITRPKEKVTKTTHFASSIDDRRHNLEASKRRKTLNGAPEQMTDDVPSVSQNQSPGRSLNVTETFGCRPISETGVLSRLSSTATEHKRRGLSILGGPRDIFNNTQTAYLPSSKFPAATSNSDALRTLESPLHHKGFFQEWTSNLYPRVTEHVDNHYVPSSDCADHSNLATYNSLLTTMASQEIATPCQRGASTRRRLVDSLGLQDTSTDNSSHDINDADRTPVSFGDDNADVKTNVATEVHQARLSFQSRHTKGGKFQKSNASPQSNSSKITYSRQRSFLRNTDISENLRDIDARADLQQNNFHLSEQARQTQSIENDGTNALGSVRSIHELRRAGGNARFQGVVDSIFEDIEDPNIPMSIRRNGLIQLCEKLCDNQFAQHFHENGFVNRLANCMTTQFDEISIFLTVCAYGLILCTGVISSTVMMTIWPKLITMTPSLLTLDEDISSLVGQRRFGLSRAYQAAIRDLSSHLRKLTVLTGHLPSWLSPQRLLLRCIQLTIRKFRESGDTAEILPVEAVSDLTRLLSTHSMRARDFDSSSKEFSILESTFSILEAHTTLSSSLEEHHQSALKPLAETSSLLLSLSKVNEGRSRQLLILHLRLLLNITNNNPSLCDEFATPDLIQSLVETILTNFKMASEDFIGEKKDSLDIIILALGALINLTEESETPRRIVLHQTSDSRSLLEHLLCLFSSGLDTISEADSVVQTHSNVAFGYLSILLCTLSLDTEIRSRVNISLGGRGLGQVLATADEFLHYHRKVDEELRQSQAPMEFTTRLQEILNQIRRLDGAEIRQ